MIPVKGGSPEINVVYIGAYVIKRLRDRDGLKMNVVSLIRQGERDLAVSVDHIILALDWLFTISAISYTKDEVFINEASQADNRS